MSTEKIEEQERIPARLRRKLENKLPAFTATVSLQLDLDLANCLGNFILDKGDKDTNPAIMALGHQLVGG